MPANPNPAPDHRITNGLVADISPHIGVLVINWAFIEQAMSAVFEATEKVALEAGVKVRRPFAFTGKRDQFKALFAGVDKLDEFRPRAAQMLDGVDNLTPLRNCVVHGSLHSYDAASGFLTFAKVNPDKGETHHVLIEHRVKLASLEPAANACTRLATDLQRLAAELMDLLDRDEPANA
ncbi:hypothetical protein ACP4J4_20210 (plasmid) [Aureimonas ureilytica]|uniref:hypothetical protein n=1 Tax=Aureimonas ureilytica TaxID=401562 RepID=UPI003CEF1871